jgi:hypothetical protein
VLICALSRIPVSRRNRKAGLYRRKATLDFDSKVSHRSAFDCSISTHVSGHYSGSWMAWYVALLISSTPLVNHGFHRQICRESLKHNFFIFYPLIPSMVGFGR